MPDLKRIFERFTGYWVYRSRYLPVGTDLRVDLTQRLGVSPTVVFDVGANTGQTYAMFRRYFPAATIHCFEPIADTFGTLEAALAGDPSARAVCLALGGESGRKTIRTRRCDLLNSLRDDLMDRSADAREETVTIETVDNYCTAYGITMIDLLKIDTEGYELPVLEGASGLLQRAAVAAVLCEVGFEKRNTRNSYFPELAEFLLPYGYVFYGLYDVTHFPGGRPSSFGNALFVHRRFFPEEH